MHNKCTKGGTETSTALQAEISVWRALKAYATRSCMSSCVAAVDSSLFALVWIPLPPAPTVQDKAGELPLLHPAVVSGVSLRCTAYVARRVR